MHFALAPMPNAIQAAHVAPPAAGVTPSAVFLRDELSLRSAHPPRKRSGLKSLRAVKQRPRRRRPMREMSCTKRRSFSTRAGSRALSRSRGPP